MTAAAAVFSAVCITNPAFAENIPLVGNVFERIGNSSASPEISANMRHL